MKILSEKEVRAKLGGIGRTTLWKMCRDTDFPKPINLSERRKGFVDSEVETYVQARIAERDGRAA